MTAAPAFWTEVTRAASTATAQAKRAAAAMLPERRALVAGVVAEGRRLFPALDGRDLAGVLPLPYRREAFGLLLEGA